MCPDDRDAGARALTAPDDDEPLEVEQVVLGDLLNHVLDKGVVISGQVTISIADVDLVAVDLRLLVTSVQTAIDRGMRAAPASAEGAAREDG